MSTAEFQITTTRSRAIYSWTWGLGGMLSLGAILSSVGACSGDKKAEGAGNGAGAAAQVEQETAISLDTSDDGNDESAVVARDYEDSDGGTTKLSDGQLEDLLSSECIGAEAEGERLPAVLEMVIDVSGSMNKTVQGEPPESGQQSKWDITKGALLFAVEALPSSVSFGAIYYPNKKATVNPPSTPGPIRDCVNTEAGLSIASLGQPGSAQRLAFQANIDSVYVDNYTPTLDAFNYGLREQLLPFGGTNRFIVIITDGAPTINEGCRWNAAETSGEGTKVLPAVVETGDGSFDAETAPIVASIKVARDTEGVRTFVIGAPGSEQSVESDTDMRSWLSAAAQAGGTERADCSNEGPNYCHFDMSNTDSNFAEELKSTLASIAGEVTNACTFKIPDPPVGEQLDSNKTQVMIEWGDDTNELIYPDSIDECQAEGWRYNEADQTIETCGVTCDRIKIDPLAIVHVSFGCAQKDFIVR